MIKKNFLIGFLLSISGLTLLCAQGITVTASIDSTQIWIGQQTQLTFELSQQPGQYIVSPVFSESIIDGLELVKPVSRDTANASDGHLIIKQSYVVTAFEDTLLLIPSFPFVEGEDTVWSNPMSLKVIQPFVIDSTKQEIADIKTVFKPKFSFLYLLKQIAPWLIGAVLLAAIIFLLIKLLKKKPQGVEIVKHPDIPADIVALNKLEKIRAEKLWHQNRHKEYHTELTDVLREYIERVFEIPAMEMTSDEILSQLAKLKKEDKSSFDALKQIFLLADLVKFAKWTAGPDEHELSLSNAFLFVNQTKTEEEKKEDVVS